MTRKILSFAAFALLAAPALFGQPDAPDPQEMMKLWEKYSTPDEHHEALGRLIGEWDYEARVVLAGMESSDKGTSSCRWVVPDLWVGCENQGTFMGKPYYSFHLNGFDKFKKNWVVATVDSSNSALNVTSGVVVDPSGKVESLYGTIDEFLTGEHDKPIRVVRRWISGDKYELDIWDLGIGETGQVVLKFAFTRKKGSKEKKAPQDGEG